MNQLIVVLTGVVAVVGAVDAVASEEWDFVAVFGLIALLQLALVVTMRRHRVAVPVRADLAAWLRARSVATGEPVERIADRCLAAARAELDPS